MGSGGSCASDDHGDPSASGFRMVLHLGGIYAVVHEACRKADAEKRLATETAIPG